MCLGVPFGRNGAAYLPGLTLAIAIEKIQVKYQKIEELELYVIRMPKFLGISTDWRNKHIRHIIVVKRCTKMLQTKCSFTQHANTS